MIYHLRVQESNPAQDFLSKSLVLHMKPLATSAQAHVNPWEQSQTSPHKKCVVIHFEVRRLTKDVNHHFLCLEKKDVWKVVPDNFQQIQIDKVLQ